MVIREADLEKNLSRNISIIRFLDGISTCVSKVLARLAGYGLILMILVVVGNVISRIIYKPFSGATELVGWICAVSTAFALGYTQMKRGFVEIEALVEHFPRGVQRVIKSIMLLVCTVFFALVSWQLFLYSADVAQNGNLSETMGIPFYPLIMVVAVGFAVLTLAIFVDFLKQLTGEC